jgi:hypothetical protein
MKQQQQQQQQQQHRRTRTSGSFLSTYLVLACIGMVGVAAFRSPTAVSRSNRAKQNTNTRGCRWALPDDQEQHSTTNTNTNTNNSNTNSNNNTPIIDTNNNNNAEQHDVVKDYRNAMSISRTDTISNTNVNNMDVVMKFGGSSLANKERIDHVATLIKDQLALGYRPRAVVCSAMGKTTNALLSAGEYALGE